MSSDRAGAGPHVPPTAGHHRNGRAEEVAWRLETDWPDDVPVTRAEVDIVERFLGDLLDELLGGRRDPR